jgi:hypothetical protein
LEKSSSRGSTPALALILLTAASMAAFGSSMIGGESGAYLRFPVGASAFAMGGAWSAAPTALSPWWNPALTGSRKERAAAFGLGFR